VRILLTFAVIGITLAIAGVIGILGVFYVYGRDLPDHSQLTDYEPAVTTRLYAANGKLLEEYAIENRVYVPVEAIPQKVINAFLAAEDRTFYQNPGIDFLGIIRAATENLANYGDGQGGLVGGSTITQQVVKNFLLTNEKTIERKIKEAILSFRISKAFNKDKILELYLNEIYLGKGSYGIAAASLNYFNKPLDELNTQEVALLAAMPKAPSHLDPSRNYERALERRNWVIERMRQDGHITDEEAEKTSKTEITLRDREPDEIARADFFAEEVRRWIMAKYGQDKLYKGGLIVSTTVDPDMQRIAERAFVEGLAEYDRRQNKYRGPLQKNISMRDWQDKLKKLDHKAIPASWHYAIVLSVTAQKARIGFESGTQVDLPYAGVKWADSEKSAANQILSNGDVILVTKAETADGKSKQWELRQKPLVNGGLVAMDPHTGKVLAMVGGFAYAGSEYNRATQAKRQPGSAFKSFVYLTALENNYSPNSIITDGPITLPQGPGMPAWSPKNYSNDFLGPVPLRVGLEKSRNAMTVRLALALGIRRIVEIGQRLGIYDKLDPNFSIVLGSAETTLIRITNAYATLVNNGAKTTPALIERVQDRYGKTIFKRDERKCKECKNPSANLDDPVVPEVPEDLKYVVEPQTAYQLVSILQGVVERGTATRARALGRPLGGKTGTTNNSMDTWFIGFSPDLVVGTYVGYDRPKNLGKKETGASVALPIFIRFMKDALKDVPPKPFKMPTGIKLARIDIETGLPADETSDPNKVIMEVFRNDNDPYGAQGVAEPGAEYGTGAGVGTGTVTTGGEIIFDPSNPGVTGGQGAGQNYRTYRRPANPGVNAPVQAGGNAGAGSTGGGSTVGTGGIY
jgi:penicillin-binding protein 1A